MTVTQGIARQSDWNVTAEAAHLTQLINDVLQQAQRLGASAAEAGVSRDQGLSVQVRQGDVENIEFNREGGFGITVYFGQRKGSASTSDTSPEALKTTVKAACDIARYTEADPYAGLADADLMARDCPDLDLDHPWDISPADAVALALRCEEAALTTHAQVKKTDSIALNSHRGVRCYGNSHGFLGAYPSTRHSLSAGLIAENENGMQRDHWYTVARDARDWMSVEQVGQIAAQRAARRLNARSIKSGDYPVLLVPEMARGFFGHFFSAIKGGSLYRHASFLCEHLGQTVWPTWLSIAESPRVPKALASGAFDDDGVATREHDLVTDGVLSSYILGAYSARRLGLQTTGNAGGLHNVRLRSTHALQPVPALLNQMQNGLVITSLMGQGVNGVTGDYSRGASGFWVENGEMVYPVEEITIAGNLKDMMHSVQALGDDIDYASSIWTGSVLLDRMSVAGNKVDG